MDGFVLNTMSVGEWIWSKVKAPGSYVVEGVKNVMTMLDGILDASAFGAAAIAFVAGVVAIGLTLGSAVLALTGLVAASTLLTIGAIGMIAGQFALYTGIFAMGASGAQYVSGSLGYRLNGEKLSEAEAKARIRNGISNLTLAYTGMTLGYLTTSYNQPYKVDDVKENNNKEYQYSQSVLNKSTADKYHTFPKLLDQYILENPVVDRGDGRIEYLARGYYNSMEGVYHITTKGDYIIHRLFLPLSEWAKTCERLNLPEYSKIPILK